MANYIFDWASSALALNTLDLSTGDYYAHLVTNAPPIGSTVVSNLTIPTSSGYTSTPLTGLSHNSDRWTFDSFSFPKHSFVSAPTGVVICKRLSAVPSINDQVICYSDFGNSVGQQITLQVGSYVVNLQFGVKGAINFSYRYQYNSGSFSANYEGIFYLMGTNNNTVSWVNPSPTKILAANNSPTDRTNSNFIPAPTAMIDFSSYRIRVGTFSWRSLGSSELLELEGSLDATNWTNLFTSTAGTGAGWQFKTVTNTDFWRYLRLKNVANIDKLELFNSSILSPTVNFT